MRLFAFIFAIYILILSIVPCADGAVCNDEKHAATEQTTNHDNEHKRQCTPFCTCACCHTIATVSVIYLPEPTTIFYSMDKTTSIYLTAPDNGLPRDIFRPPSMA